ncbi:carboxypeptidase-like regulatory domain-containing protein [Christiangramia echinicola]|uniref:carboxypeptidase-like regulatory domain-containing protein n=1 Tax=Christiangramia echinicola TaxID=279359 RepID=UPI0003FF2046|nr:carboxypeptidase-like regulatory domain-containing protein [Christiangramia echinicola]
MKISIFWVFTFIFINLNVNSQNSAIKGRLVDAITDVPLPQVKIAIQGSFTETLTEADGTFSIGLETIAIQEVILIISRTGYITKRLPVKITSEIKTLEKILLQPDEFQERSQQSTITLSESEILSEEGEFDNISGILQSTRDVYLSAAAFDFSQTFFRVRGLGSEYGKLLINGIEMNKLYDGRPQWSNWGGLNDVQRNQVLSNGIASGEYSFGGLGGTTNILMRASKYQKGTRVSVAGSNRSYTGRLMATYASGEKGNGWFYAFSIARRYAEEGYMDGTLYDSNSFFASIEKKIDDKHSLNFSGFYTPVTRGKSSPLTQEVLDLKGRKYNPYWGYQEGEIRNSRLREVEEPVLMINHFWKVSSNIDLNTNFAYQFGEVANSRIDYGGTTMANLDGQEAYLGGGANPDPSYYQKLPGYYLRYPGSENYEAAFRVQKDFKISGQLDWDQLYLANTSNSENGNNAIYALTDDVNQDKQLTANLILDWKIRDNFKINTGVRYTALKSYNFARITDLFGGNNFLDIDVFAEEVAENPLVLAKQSNLLNPNRLVEAGEKYKYDYDISSNLSEAFIQTRYNFKRLEWSLTGKLGTVQYQRKGNYQNGIFSETSLGNSDKVIFLDFGLKSGFIYKFSGRQNIEFNLGYFSKPPGFRNVFVNPRQNNEVVDNSREEIIQTTDLSYRYRSSKFNVRLTGYLTRINNATEISYYFTNGLGGLGAENTAAFVQEVLTEIDKRLLGLEFGSEYQVTTTLKVKAVASLGQFIFANNPSLYLSSASFSKDFGKSNLKDYYLAGGPQRAALVGFEYRDPAYWWFGATVNYFSHGFIDINPLTRTSNFQTDYDGFPLLDYDNQIAQDLLKQEQFQSYFLVNMVGGKSWRIKDKYLGFFMSINNLLDKEYKSGGFEQARNSNYRILKEDMDREIPVFGNKYWLGYGTSFFANLSFRF